jgi:hypothetical protein
VNPSKSSVLTSAVIALVGTPLLSTTCYGFAEVARGAVTLETELRLSYDSYFIGARAMGDDDYFATLQPTLKYTRRAGLAELDAFAGVAILRHDTNTQFDSENFQAGLRSSLPVVEGSRLSGSVDLAYTESTQIDYDVMDRVPTESIRATAQFEYKLGLKTSISDSIGYSKTDRATYSDQETFGNDLSFNYTDFLRGTNLRLTHGYLKTKSSGENFLGADLDQESNSFAGSLSRPIVGPLRGELTYGYRILDRGADESIIGETEHRGSFFGATLSGPFLSPIRFPKIESSASLSYSEASSPGLNDVGEKTLTGHVRLGWIARERTRFSFDASRSVDLSATDLSVENTRVSAGVTQSVGLATSIGVNLAYYWRDFRGVDRSDETLDASLNIGYKFSRNWSAGAAYSYQNNRTDGEDMMVNPAYFRMRPNDYERHLVSVYVTNVF